MSFLILQYSVTDEYPFHIVVGNWIE